ncbi:hypothetical protein O59_001344 [Cellvibrio sp. BR]|nr:hypothetical protein O59_001344 [Cellvibrio sp. BR]
MRSNVSALSLSLMESNIGVFMVGIFKLRGVKIDEMVGKNC